VCVSVSDGAGLTEFYEPGPAIADTDWAALEAAAGEIAGRATWVAVAGSLPPGAPPDAAARLLGVARAAGARVALDVSGEALRLGLAACPDFVKVNAEEAADLGLATAEDLRAATGGGTAPGAGQGAASSGSAGRGLPAAAITRGADGMELATAEGVLRAVPPRLGAYPVGSGDSALGGFLAALDAGADWAAALHRAAEAAAANAQVPGAGRLG